MYPIDAIKVRNICLAGYVKDLLIDFCTDTDANPEPDTLGGLQWHDTRRLPNSYGGRILEFMERHVLCSCRCRSVPFGRQG
jgi:hypothetical protein